MTSVRFGASPVPIRQQPTFGSRPTFGKSGNGSDKSNGTQTAAEVTFGGFGAALSALFLKRNPQMLKAIVTNTASRLIKSGVFKFLSSRLPVQQMKDRAVRFSTGNPMTRKISNFISNGMDKLRSSRFNVYRWFQDGN